MLVQHRRGRGSPPVELRANVGLPKPPSRMIERKHPGLPKEHIDLLSVRHRCARGIPVVLPDSLLFGQFRGDHDIPLQLTRDTIETKQMPFEGIHVPAPNAGAEAGVAGEKNMITENDGTRRPGTGQVGLPDDAVGIAPLKRRPFGVPNSRTAGTVKLRPIGGAKSYTGKKQTEE